MNRGIVIACALVAAAAAAMSSMRAARRRQLSAVGVRRQLHRARPPAGDQRRAAARSKSPKSSGTAAATATRSTRRSRPGRQKKPAFIEFVRMPVIWGPPHVQHARLYYTLQALRRGDLHSKVFDAIHQDGDMLAARTSDEQARALQLAFLKQHGVTEQQFNAAYDSMPSRCNNVKRAETLTGRYEVGSVPVDHRERQRIRPACRRPAAPNSCSPDQRSRRPREAPLASARQRNWRYSHPMLSAFVPQPQGLARFELRAGAAIPGEAIWLDLLEPTPSEERQVESFLSIDVPTRDEMRRSKRRTGSMKKTAALYMTATVVTKLDSDLPESTQITFILSGCQAGHQSLRRSAAIPPLHRLRRAPSEFLQLAAGGAGGPGRGRRQSRRRRHRAGGHRPGWRLGRGVQRIAPETRRHARLPQDARAPRSERRTHLQGARKPGEPGTAADLRAAEHRGAHVRGCARPFPHAVARRAWP